MKKTFKAIPLFALVTLIGFGCASGDDSDQTKLTFYSNKTSEADQTTMDNVIDKFEEENPEIEIDQNYPTSEYESQLRVKMGANDMPDMFDTHGWAQNRYGDYVEDLQDMDWVDDLDESLEPVLEDSEGKVYAYPLNQANDGLTYNADILDEYDIDPPETFDNLMAALKTIKQESGGDVTPLWLAGSDKEDLAQFMDEFMSPLLVTSDDNDYTEELLDGSFDWAEFNYLPEKIKEMQDEGLLNEDVLTAQAHEKEELMAQDKVAFVISTLPADSVKELNSDINLGITPVPSIHEGDDTSWIGGERHTVAVSNESDYKEEAKQFIEFLSQPEIVKETAEGSDLPTGLTNEEADIYYSDYYDEYEDIEVEPYFDREYLPGGMWDVMGTTTQELLSGDITPEQMSEEMGDEYKRLLKEDDE